MKKLLTIFLFFPLIVQSQVVGKISINLTAGVQMEETQMMYFSNIISTGASTIIMTPSGERSAIGNVTFLDEYSSPGKFMITGAPLATFKVSFGTIGTMTNGKTNLTVSELKTSLTNNIGQTDANGKAMFQVGCKIQIPLTASSGVYNATYQITSSYE